MCTSGRSARSLDEFIGKVARMRLKRAPGQRAITAKNTVRIFSRNPRTHRVSAVDVTLTTDWVLTPNGWLLRHTHKPIRNAVPLEGGVKNARAGVPGRAPL